MATFKVLMLFAFGFLESTSQFSLAMCRQTSELLESELATLAEKIPFLPNETFEFQFDPEGDLDFDPVESKAIQRFSSLAKNQKEQEWIGLLENANPKIRTLAIIALSWRERPTDLDKIASLCNDLAPTFSLRGAGPQQTELRVNGQPKRRELHPQTVSRFAEEYVSRYLTASGYARSNDFVQYWSTHKHRDDCYGWLKVSLHIAYRNGNATKDGEAHTLFKRLRNRIDALPSPNSELVLLGLSTPGLNRKQVDDNGQLLATEARQIEAAKSLGKPALLDLLDGKMNIDDPDMIDAPGKRSVYPLLQVQRWLLQRVTLFFDLRDGKRILGNPNSPLRVQRIIAASTLLPERANDFLQAAFDWCEMGAGREKQEYRGQICLAMWQLVGEPRKQFIVNWYLSDPEHFTGLDLYVDEFSKQNGQSLLTALWQDPRLNSQNWWKVSAMVSATNRLQPELIQYNQEETLRAFGIEKTGRGNSPRKETIRNQKTVDELIEKWRQLALSKNVSIK